MNDWKKVKLGDVCDLIAGYAFKSNDFGTIGSYVIKIKDIQPPIVNIHSADKVDLSKYDIEKLNKYKIVKGDFLFAMTGATIGKIGKYLCNEISYLNQRVLMFKPKDSVNKKYIYYYLLKNDFHSYVLNHIDSESAQPNISANTISNYIVEIPNIFIQEKIAAILGCLDDKIEINNKINANLENQAQTIFKHYFVDNKEKENWGKIELGKYCNVKSGFAFKSSWWKNKGIKVIKIKNINEDGSLDIKDCSYVGEDKKDLAKEFIVKGGDLLIAMTGATIGKFAIVPNTKEILLVNQRVGKFFLGNEPLNKLPFIYCALRQDDIINQIINKGQGSAQPNISSSDIETITLLIPNEDTINEFNLLTRHNFEMIINNHYETQKLINLRDTLLPKLMNGEIKI